MARVWFKLAMVILGLCFVYAIWLASYLAYIDTIYPQTMGMTIAELKQQIGEPANTQPHLHNGSSYLIWSGEVKTIFMPSGPPVYLFDSNDKLVDWTRDIGDDPEFRAKWGL